jgi:hypothetical protein
MLRDIRIASPCSADWEKMVGDDRVRFCTECSRNVYNLSAMAATDAEAFVSAQTGRLCVRFYQRVDGTLLNEDCPVGWARVRNASRKMSRVAGAALSAAISLSLAAAQNTKTEPTLVQIEPAKDGVVVEVTDESGAVIPRADVMVSDERRTLEMVADSTGRAAFRGLPPGEYRIEVKANGFRALAMGGIRIPAQHTLRATLRVGSTALMGEVVFLDMPLEPTPAVITSLLEEAPDPPIAVVPAQSLVPHRNRVMIFFGDLRHKLGL